MSTQMILHSGAQEVTKEDLEAIQVPPATSTWFPISHARVLDTTSEMLGQAGFQISRTRLALSGNRARFFGTLDLQSSVATGVNLSVGVRNSLDKTLPIGFCVGSRVFVCDNLAFTSQIIISRKHTRFGDQRFREAMCQAVKGLAEYRRLESGRIRRLQHSVLSPDAADALLLGSYESGILSGVMLPRVIQEWRKPSYDEFLPRTKWSLFNAFTTIFAERQRTNPQQFSELTIRLHDLSEGSQNASEIPQTIAA